MSEFFGLAWRQFWYLWSAFFYILAKGFHDISRFCLDLAEPEEGDRG